MIIDLDTGSPAGVHHHMQNITCARKAQLDQMRREQGLPTPGGNKNTTIGSIAHGYMAIYYRGGAKRRGFDTAKIQFRHKLQTETYWEECQVEADRVFRAYRATFSPVELGKVVAVEEPFVVKEAPWLPEGLVLTGRVDLIVDINAKVAKALSRWGHFLPGRYIVDHKFVSRISPALLTSYNLSLQFVTYPQAWEAARPRGKPIAGTIVNIITKETKPKFRRYQIPRQDDEVALLQSFLELSKKRALAGEANLLACGNWQEPCGYFLTGECRRY